MDMFESLNGMATEKSEGVSVYGDFTGQNIYLHCGGVVRFGLGVLGLGVWLCSN
jgi:hypothetical protein